MDIPLSAACPGLLRRAQEWQEALSEPPEHRGSFLANQ
jgi:hypothetical protein